MKVFSAEQVKEWDAFTIANEPVASINLMERAARVCCNWVLKNSFPQNHIHFFCGKGNNGGDGLAMARMLIQLNCNVTVYIADTPEADKKGSPDFQTNLQRLRPLSTGIHFIQSAKFLPILPQDDIIIDALFGTGLNKPPEGIYAALIDHINRSKVPVISIDLPSGLFADQSSKGNIIVKATHTLSFQHYKLAFLLPENELYCGEVHLLDIGLHRDFDDREEAAFELTDLPSIKKIYKPRRSFAHKGAYGHAALVTGSYGMMGASVLSASACLRSGAGKLTCCIPKCGNDILQTSVPEAMCMVSGEHHILPFKDMERFDAIGIGPGIGIYTSHTALLKEIFQKVNKPMLVDADALNCMAEDGTLLADIPPLSILTPHPKEFERLFGSVDNDFERLQLAMHRSKELCIYIVLKGHYTFISTPGGKAYFNSTGNAGMATAGSGDVLSGIITGLLAQGYTSLPACLLGTYLHGLAGDIAAEKLSQEAMIAGDIIHYLGDAFKLISA